MDKKKWLVGLLLFVVVFVSLIALGVSNSGCDDDDGGTTSITVGENPDLDGTNAKIGTDWTNPSLSNRNYWAQPFYTTGLLVITPESFSFFSTYASHVVEQRVLTLKNFNDGGVWGSTAEHPAGTSSLKWKASIFCDKHNGQIVGNWLSLSAYEGTLAPKESVPIMVSANPYNLPESGTYTGSITLYSDSDVDNTYYVPVLLNISYTPAQQVLINFVEKHPVATLALLIAYCYYQDPGCFREMIKEEAELRLSVMQTKQLLKKMKPKELAINTQELLIKVGGKPTNPAVIEKLYQNTLNVSMKNIDKVMQTKFSASEREEINRMMKSIQADKLGASLGYVGPQEPIVKLLQKYKIPYNSAMQKQAPK